MPLFPKLNPAERVMSFELEGGLQLTQESFVKAIEQGTNKKDIPDGKKLTRLLLEKFKDKFSLHWSSETWNYQKNEFSSCGFYNNTNISLPNGCKFYGDLGDELPETANYECDSARRVVIADLATRKFISSHLDGLWEGLDVAYYADNIDISGTQSEPVTHGGHENYYCEPSLFKKISTKNIWYLFLVTRQIYTGSGCYVPQEIAERKVDPLKGFQISQRSHVINDLAADRTTYSRPIINLRDESFSPPEIGSRLHLINGDTNMLAMTTFMKFFTTSLVLKALEDGILDKLETLLDYKYKEHAVVDVKEIARHTGAWTLNGLNTNIIKGNSAVGAQRMIYHAIREAYYNDHKTDEITKFGLDEWGKILDNLDKLEGRVDKDGRNIDNLEARQFLSQRVDHVNKKEKIDGLSRLNGHAFDFDASASYSHDYHLTNAQDGGLLNGPDEQLGIMAEWITHDEINAAQHTPNCYTRATIRSYILHRAKEIASFRQQSSTHTERFNYLVGWDHARIVLGNKTLDLIFPDAEKTYLEGEINPSTGNTYKFDIDEIFFQACLKNKG
jgi:Pup-ligase protein